jgi:hypothetical protein
MLAKEALDKCLKLDGVNTVLDIGPGKGEAMKAFQEAGKEVYAVDNKPQISNVRLMDFNYPNFVGWSNQFDLVWCSHVLEHQRNVDNFLTQIYRITKMDGWVAITVPPAKPEIVGGHVSMWNAGLLVYNMVLTGFDCSGAMIKTYDYNCSVIVQKKQAILPDLQFAQGDIERLKPFLPDFFCHGVNGEIESWNWTKQEG